MITSSVWTSLEIVKLLIAAATPIITGIIAYKLATFTKRLEKTQWTDRKLIEKRIEIYEVVVPELNELLCFYCYIGNWKEITPLDIVKKKRLLDKKIHVYAPLFKSDLLKAYDEFIASCFETFTGWGKDAKIRSLYNRRKEVYEEKWQKGWEDMFCDGKKVLDVKEIRNSYLKLIEIFKTELEVYGSEKYANIKMPQNIKPNS